MILGEVDYRIRTARADEVEAMQAIDIASARLFSGMGLIDFGQDDSEIPPIPEDIIRRGFADGLVWVAVDDRDRPVGFALCTARGEDLYLDQLSVTPIHGRKGLGGRLVDHIIEEAAVRAFKYISLSTFKKVPWNGPFYKKKGFKQVRHGRLKPWQLDLHERQKQTMDVTQRCFMQRSVKRGWW